MPEEKLISEMRRLIVLSSALEDVLATQTDISPELLEATNALFVQVEAVEVLLPPAEAAEGPPTAKRA